MSVAPELAAWARTVLVFGAGEFSIALSEPVGDASRAALAAIGLPLPFAVVTPCNPQGQRLLPDANARRLAAAAAMLDARGTQGVPVIGTATDGSHWEPGWALALTREEAVALAAEWGQLGIYWWDGHRFSIVLITGEEMSLPLETGKSPSASG